MARIRYIKPEFFVHETLNDMEQQHPELRVMLTFAGLWCMADREGYFRYSVRTIHNSVLPYVDFDIRATLELLAEKGFIKVFPPCEEGFQVAQVVNFNRHQYIPSTEKKSVLWKAAKQSQPEPPQPEAAQTTIPEIAPPPTGIIEQLTGDLFIDEVCMNNGFSPSEFKTFAEVWAKNKVITGDSKYRIGQLRRYLIEDYRKELKTAKPNGRKIKQPGEVYVGM